jgi:hypothetical protein
MRLSLRAHVPFSRLQFISDPIPRRLSTLQDHLAVSILVCRELSRMVTSVEWLIVRDRLRGATVQSIDHN